MKRFMSERYAAALAVFALLAAVSFSAGCGDSGPKEDVITTLKRQLMNLPEFSVMLIDMKEEGSFSKKYFHKFKIVKAENDEQAKKGITAQKVEESDWTQVNEKSYKALQPYLGMTVLSKKFGGEISQTAQPGGYMHVGNSQYGSWQNGTWTWLPAYAGMMTTMYFMDRGAINRGGYDRYNDSVRRGSPYMGDRNQYGTNGTAGGGAFARQRSRMAAKKSDFANRARSRAGRTSSGSSSGSTSRSSFRGGGK